MSYQQRLSNMPIPDNKKNYNDFEKEMEKLIQIDEDENLLQIQSNNNKILDKNNIIKCCIIVIVCFLILHSNLLKLFEKYIPTNIFNILNSFEKIFYYFIIFIILYILYYLNYI